MLQTPLCAAARNGHTAVVEILVKARADVNKVSYTPGNNLLFKNCLAIFLCKIELD